MNPRGPCLLLLLLALSACGRRERPDPRLAEVEKPVHVTVRVIDVTQEKHCEGTFTEQLACLVTRAPHEGCVYVEAGKAADTPERAAKPDPARCDSLRYSADRVLLSGEPAKKASLFLEPGGGRVVVELGDAWHALYLRDGRLVLHRPLGVTASRPVALTRPDGTLDWTQVPPLLAVLDEAQLEDLTDAQLDALLASAPGGQRALTQALLALAPSASLVGKGWDRALSKLGQAERVQVRDELLAAVSGGNQAALEWFLAHEQEQGPALVEAMEGAMSADPYLTELVLPALLKLAPQRAEQVACDQLEQHWHEVVSLGTGEYEGSLPPEPIVLAVIVERKTKCPWVMPLLERDPCLEELHCDPDLEDEVQTPLCTAAQAARALERTLHPSPEPAEDATETEEVDDGSSHWGALLVAAARIQGPFSPAFTLANERRLYPVATTVAGDAGEDPCAELSPGPADWACRLPPQVSTAKSQGCRLVLDDVKKTATLSPLEADGGVPVGDPRPWTLRHE